MKRKVMKSPEVISKKIHRFCETSYTYTVLGLTRPTLWRRSPIKAQFDVLSSKKFFKAILANKLTEVDHHIFRILTMNN